MAKIITEQFRSETTKELFDSFVSTNDALVEQLKAATFPAVAVDQAITGALTVTGDGQRYEETDAFADAVGTLLDSSYNPESTYYIMASNISIVPEISNTQVAVRDFLSNVVFGQRVTQDEVRYMFPFNPWTSGTVYDAFDDTKDVESQNMFAAVADGETSNVSYRIYKCIQNNNGSPSTSEPPSPTGQETNPFEVKTADNYVWKFMFEVDVDNVQTYATSTLLPCPEGKDADIGDFFGDIEVIKTAQETVSDILIEDTVDGLFSEYVITSDLNTETGLDFVEATDVSDSDKKIKVRYPANARQDQNAFNGMIILTPTKKLLYTIIDTEPVDGNINAELTLRPIDEDLTSSTDLAVLDFVSGKLTIVPTVSVSKSKGARSVAYAKLDEFGTVTDVVVAKGGTQYKKAAATLTLPPLLSQQRGEEGSGTTLRCIVSSKGGHGSDPIKELAMSRLVTVTNFQGSDTQIPNSNTYTQVALVKNPSFVDQAGNAIDPPPSRFDNRTQLVVPGEVNNVVLKETIEQDFLDISNTFVDETQTISSTIHEIEYDSGNDETTYYVVGYDGAFSEVFTPGTVTEPKNIRIGANQITKPLNSVTSGTYVAYSGDLLHFVDFDPIERAENRTEKIKFVFDF